MNVNPRTYYLDRRIVRRKNRRKKTLVPLYWVLLISSLLVGLACLCGMGWFIIYIIRTCLIYL
jgi:1,4-dihydroxy-2-naphthoate octaprenyltransferase